MESVGLDAYIRRIKKGESSRKYEKTSEESNVQSDPVWRKIYLMSGRRTKKEMLEIRKNKKLTSFGG